MNAGRTARITLLVAEQAAGRGARVGVADVCAAAVAALPVGGAGLSAMSDTAVCHPMCSTDGISERTEADRWPAFIEAARLCGFGAVQALPLRLRDEVVGALNLFRTAPGRFDPAAAPLAQALADVATISLLQQRSAHRSTVLNEQLQAALNSRVVIEQAKGKLAERQGLDMEQAFTTLRDYARAHNRRLADLAHAFVEGAEPLPGLST